MISQEERCLTEDVSGRSSLAAAELLREKMAGLNLDSERKRPFEADFSEILQSSCLEENRSFVSMSSLQHMRGIGGSNAMMTSSGKAHKKRGRKSALGETAGAIGTSLGNLFDDECHAFLKGTDSQRNKKPNKSRSRRRAAARKSAREANEAKHFKESNAINVSQEGDDS